MHMDRKNLIMLAMIRGWQPPPSVTELQEATGFRSTNTVNMRLLWMEKEGLIVNKPGKRNVVATEKGMAFFPEFVVLRPEEMEYKQGGDNDRHQQGD